MRLRLQEKFFDEIGNQDHDLILKSEFQSLTKYLLTID